jgi:hypothetical protein
MFMDETEPTYGHQRCPRCGSDDWLMDVPPNLITCTRPTSDVGDELCGAAWNPWTGDRRN